MDEKPPFYLAVEKGNIDIIKLLSKKDNINEKISYKKYRLNINDDGLYGFSIKYYDMIEEKPPFYLAIEKDNIEVIENLFLRVSGNINKPNIKITSDEIKEETPLQLVFKTNKIKFFPLILEYENRFINHPVYTFQSFGIIRRSSSPIKINDKSIEGKIGEEIEFIEKTPLYSAVENKSIEAVQFLLKRPEININEKCFLYMGNNQTQSKTALHLAVEKGYKDIIKLLMENKNTDANVEDEQGKKPIDYTTNNEIKQMLNK